MPGPSVEAEPVVVRREGLGLLPLAHLEGDAPHVLQERYVGLFQAVGVLRPPPLWNDQPSKWCIVLHVAKGEVPAWHAIEQARSRRWRTRALQGRRVPTRRTRAACESAPRRAAAPQTPSGSFRCPRRGAGSSGRRLNSAGRGRTPFARSQGSRPVVGACAYRIAVALRRRFAVARRRQGPAPLMLSQSGSFTRRRENCSCSPLAGRWAVLLNGESAFCCNLAARSSFCALLLARSGTANVTTTRRTVPQR